MQKIKSFFPWIPAVVLMMTVCFLLPVIDNGLASDRTGYMRQSAFSADIYYKEPDQDYVETVAQCLDFYAPLIYADFSVEETPDVTVIIYENARAMAEALGIDENAAPMGLYYGGAIHILSPSAWIENGPERYVKEKFVKEGPLIHELTHLTTDIKTGGNYSIWLTEGVALYYENKYAAFEWRADLKEESASLSIDDLENHFRNLDEAAAYRRSYDIVNDYVARNGEDALQTALSGLKDSGAARDIFEPGLYLTEQ
jgi:hypothetical protein